MKAKNIAKLARRRVRPLGSAMAAGARREPAGREPVRPHLQLLHTILELEPDLERLQFGHYLLRDFNILKMFLSHVEEIDVEEQDVARIEAATENFSRNCGNRWSKMKRTAQKIRRTIGRYDLATLPACGPHLFQYLFAL
jgi:hypothetical protein